ncbi:WecB/TagA/CpsF family glycosyltransferase [Enterococcus bulliens]
MDEFTNLILSNKEKKAYFAINTDCYNIAEKDEMYRKILSNQKNIIYVDGMGIIYGQKITNSEVAVERIATTDLFIELLKKSNRHKFYLLGGKPGTVENLIENMSKIYPNAEFIGHHHGYYQKEEEKKIISEINNLNPDFLFVGFGCPKQEKWINENIDYLNASNIISCGGLFDYYSNNVRRAPNIMQKYGLEWVFRLVQEPKRLYKRYILGNPKFLINMLSKKHKNLHI